MIFWWLVIFFYYITVIYIIENCNIFKKYNNKEINILVSQCVWYNKEIIPEVKLVPEAQPRDTNNRGVLSLLSTLARKRILMARSLAEGPSF